MRFGLSSAVTALAAGAVALLAFPVLAQQPGEPVCVKCHETAYPGMALTKHGAKGDPRTPFGSGRDCQSCHGDATEHLKAPRKNPMPVRFGPGGGPEQNDACASCHQGGSHVNWQGSGHDRSRVACASCHTVHAARDQVLVKATQAGVCFTCHQDKRADMFRFSSHPLRTGWMACSSCHAPHGSVGDFNLIRNTVNETCYTCHADKRGPFLWEHPPARENCAECHNPHGSNNSQMLKVRGPYLCQQCHVAPFHPSTLYSGSNLPPNLAADKMLGQNCANCHPKVHGSNHPSGARFTR